MIRAVAMLVLALTLAAGTWLAMRPGPAPEPREPIPVAVDFIARYVDEHGRIADTANGGISHSEGQGYGLLMAEAAGDRVVFDRILDWTVTHLGVREDGLFSWRWDPAANAITDPNNATDGEILIAWALMRADDRWSVAAYRSRAERILDAVEAGLVRETATGPVILPGATGFEHSDRIVVNPSYWVFPAMRRFAAEGRTIWDEIADTGYKLTAENGFGRYSLLPDWMQITSDGGVAPAAGWPPEFSYNAVRIPLHICWDRLTSTRRPPETGALEGYALLWAAHPAGSFDKWNVKSDEPSGGAAPQGFTDIANLTGACARQSVSQRTASIEAGTAYYSAALTGLVALALQDGERP